VFLASIPCPYSVSLSRLLLLLLQVPGSVADTTAAVSLRALLLQRRSGVAGMRAAIAAAGYADIAAFKAAAAAAQIAEEQRLTREAAARYAAQRAAREAAQLAKQQERQQRRQQQQQGQLTCACGNAAAAACSRSCCGNCCKKAGGCNRHKVGGGANFNRHTGADFAFAMSWFGGRGSGQF
jgi:hypothetical protein